MARYLVTGATGFLGAHLVDALVAQGHEVRALARHFDGITLPHGVRPVVGDVCQANTLGEALSHCDGVFHAAGYVSRKTEDAQALFDVHVTGTRNVLEAAVRAKVPRVVHVSTSGTVGISEHATHIATEADDAPVGLLGRWPYYRSKWLAEQEALEFRREGLAVVSVNPSLLLGPGDRRGSSTEEVRLFLERKLPVVPRGGLAFVDVRDAARGAIAAMERGVAGQRYILSAINLTFRAFFGKLERVSGVASPVLPLPTLGAVGLGIVGSMVQLAEWVGLTVPVDPVSFEMAQHYWYVDASKAERELRWSSRDPLETLRDTVDDLRARGVVWPD